MVQGGTSIEPPVDGYGSVSSTPSLLPDAKSTNKASAASMFAKVRGGANHGAAYVVGPGSPALHTCDPRAHQLASPAPAAVLPMQRATVTFADSTNNHHRPSSAQVADVQSAVSTHQQQGQCRHHHGGQGANQRHVQSLSFASDDERTSIGIQRAGTGSDRYSSRGAESFDSYDDEFLRASRASVRAVRTAVPGSLRNRKPTLMHAVLDDSKDGNRLRKGIAAKVHAKDRGNNGSNGGTDSCCHQQGSCLNSRKRKSKSDKLVEHFERRIAESKESAARKLKQRQQLHDEQNWTGRREAEPLRDRKSTMKQKLEIQLERGSLCRAKLAARCCSVLLWVWVRITAILCMPFRCIYNVRPSRAILVMFLGVMLGALWNQARIVNLMLYSDPNVWPKNDYNPAGRTDHSASNTALGATTSAVDDSTGWEPTGTMANTVSGGGSTNNNESSHSQSNSTSAVLPRSQQFVQHFELNDPIAAFVSVTGLVFALVFASNYTDAQSRLSEIRNSLAVEAGGVHTAMLLVRTLDDTDPGGNYKTRVLLLLASYIDHVSEEIEWYQRGNDRGVSNFFGLFGKGRGSETGQWSTGSNSPTASAATDTAAVTPPDSTVEILYATLPFLGEIAMDGDGDAMDHILVQRTVDSLKEASSARQIRITAEKRNISPWIYCFLWQMALVTFGGVLFIQAGSQTLNSFIVGMTILSISSSMFILADLEEPYTGLVCVEVDIFNTIRHEIALVLHEKFTELDDLNPSETEDGDTGQECWDGIPSKNEQHDDSLHSTETTSRNDVGVGDHDGNMQAMTGRHKHTDDGRVDQVSSNAGGAYPLQYAPGIGTVDTSKKASTASSAAFNDRLPAPYYSAAATDAVASTSTCSSSGNTPAAAAAAAAAARAAAAGSPGGANAVGSTAAGLPYSSKFSSACTTASEQLQPTLHVDTEQGGGGVLSATSTNKSEDMIHIEARQRPQTPLSGGDSISSTKNSTKALGPSRTNSVSKNMKIDCEAHMRNATQRIRRMSTGQDFSTAIGQLNGGTGRVSPMEAT